MTSPILDSDELDILDGGGYEGSAYLILGPQETVFAARVGTPPTLTSFAAFPFDTVTVGAYTDALEGQSILISRTNDRRKAYWRGRVREPFAAAIAYVDEDSPALADGDYIFVIDNYEALVKQRRLTYVDYDKPYEGLGPVAKGINCASAVLTTAATAEFSFPNLVGQALTKGTTIASYAWSIPDAVYTTGSAASQNPVIEVDTPYNRWGRLTIEDSDGVTRDLVFTLTAGDPNNPAHTFFRLCHDPIPITADWSNGYSTSVLFWRGLDDVLDRSRVTVVVEERFREGTLDNIGNVRFVGYLDATSSTIRGDEQHGQIKEVSVELAGLLQAAGELRFNPIAIRHTTTPTAWDQIDTPTPARVICHVLAQHSTLLNICALDFGAIDDTYFSGNTDVNQTSLMDAVRQVASEINAYITQGAAGMLSFERDPRLMDSAERDALPVVTPSPLTLGNGYSFKLDYISDEKVGAVEVGFVVFLTDTNTRYYLTANGPASGFGDGQGQQQIPNQLLSANSSIEDAKIEGGIRTGNLLALANARRVINMELTGGWDLINPSPGEWYNFIVAAADDPRGVGVAATERWLCVSKSATITRDGRQVPTAQFAEETSGGSYLNLVSYSPSVANTELAVLPVRSVMAAFPSLPSINYDTTDPTNRQRRGPFDGWVASPLTPEEAAAAALAQSRPGCQTAATNFRYNSNVALGFTTVLGADYLLTVSGSALIGTSADSAINDFTIDQQGWTAVNGLFAIYDPPDGWQNGGGGNISINRATVPNAAHTLVLTFNQASTEMIQVSNSDDFSGSSNYTPTAGVTRTINLGSDYVPGDGISIIVVGVLDPALRLESIEFLAGTGDPLYADAFYSWEVDADNIPINVSLLSNKGLRLDNAAVSVPPPFSPNHIYTIPFTGTGNPINFRFEDTDHTDNQSAPFYLEACGEDAGQ